MGKKGRFGPLGLIVSRSHTALGLQVAGILGVEPLGLESNIFPNGELAVRRLGDVSGLDVCILSSLHSRFDTVGELRRICSTIRGSAARVFGVFPFVRDGKSDHVKRFGESLAYKETASLIASSGLDAVAIFDQHSSQHPGMYDTTHYNLRVVHHVYLMRLLIEYVMSRAGTYGGVLALDAGGFKRNTSIATKLGLPVSFIIKERDASTRLVSIDGSRIVGDVEGQIVASFDDMVQEGGTLEMGALIAKAKGAREIHFFVVHPDFSVNTRQRLNPLLENGTIDRIHVLGTIPLVEPERWHKNMVVLSPASLIADVITHIHMEGHMRDLFLEL